ELRRDRGGVPGAEGVEPSTRRDPVGDVRRDVVDRGRLLRRDGDGGQQQRRGVHSVTEPSPASASCSATRRAVFSTPSSRTSSVTAPSSTRSRDADSRAWVQSRVPGYVTVSAVATCTIWSWVST